MAPGGRPWKSVVRECNPEEGSVSLNLRQRLIADKTVGLVEESVIASVLEESVIRFMIEVLLWLRVLDFKSL